MRSNPGTEITHSTSNPHTLKTPHSVSEGALPSTLPSLLINSAETESEPTASTSPDISEPSSCPPPSPANIDASTGVKSQPTLVAPINSSLNGGKPLAPATENRLNRRRRTSFTELNNLTIFQRFVHNPVGAHQFLKYLETEHSEENLQFWTSSDRFQTYLQSSRNEAQSIYDTFLKPSAPRELNISASLRRDMLADLSEFMSVSEKYEKVLEKSRASIYHLMFQDSFMRFLKSQVTKVAKESLYSSYSTCYARDLLGMGEAWVVTDPYANENLITDVSDAFLAMTGYDTKSLLNKPFSTLFQGPHTTPPNFNITTKLNKMFNIGANDTPTSNDSSEPVQKVTDLTALTTGIQTDLLVTYNADSSPSWSLIVFIPIMKDSETISKCLFGFIDVTESIIDESGVSKLLFIRHTSNAATGNDATVADTAATKKSLFTGFMKRSNGSSSATSPSATVSPTNDTPAPGTRSLTPNQSGKVGILPSGSGPSRSTLLATTTPTSNPTISTIQWDPELGTSKLIPGGVTNSKTEMVVDLYSRWVVCDAKGVVINISEVLKNEVNGNKEIIGMELLDMFTNSSNGYFFSEKTAVKELPKWFKDSKIAKSVTIPIGKAKSNRVGKFYLSGVKDAEGKVSMFVGVVGVESN